MSAKLTTLAQHDQTIKKLRRKSHKFLIKTATNQGLKTTYLGPTGKIRTFRKKILAKMIIKNLTAHKRETYKTKLKKLTLKKLRPIAKKLNISFMYPRKKGVRRKGKKKIDIITEILDAGKTPIKSIVRKPGRTAVRPGLLTRIKFLRERKIIKPKHQQYENIKYMRYLISQSTHITAKLFNEVENIDDITDTSEKITKYFKFLKNNRQLIINEKLTKIIKLNLIKSIGTERIIIRYQYLDEFGEEQKVFFTASRDTIQQIYTSIMEGLRIDSSYIITSNELRNFYVREIYNITASKFVPPVKTADSDGAFFPLANISPFDLSRYQIYSEKQYEQANYNEFGLKHCLIHAFEVQGMSQQNLAIITQYVQKTHFKRFDLNKMARKMNIKIRFSQLRPDTNTIRTRIINKQATKLFKIGLINSHYIADDSININIYGAKHWREIQGSKYYKKHCNKVIINDFYGAKHERFTIKRKWTISPIKIISELIKCDSFVHSGVIALNDLFTKSSELDLTQIYSDTTEISDLEQFTRYLNTVNNQTIKVKWSEFLNNHVSDTEALKSGYIEMCTEMDEITYVVKYKKILPEYRKIVKNISLKSLKTFAEKRMIKALEKIESENYTSVKAFNLIKREISIIKIPREIIFADFEATANIGQKHQAYQISMTRNYAFKKFHKQIPAEIVEDFNNAHKPYMISHFGADSGIYFIKNLPRNAQVYFHNLKYDKSHIINHTRILSSVEKSGVIYEYTLTRNIKLRDSMKHINSALKNFPKMFGLTGVQKEIYPYTAYDTYHINKHKMKISHALKHLKQEYHNDFIANIDRMHLRINNKFFDHVAYCKFYCNQDVTILAQGFMKFRQMMFQAVDIDIFNQLTISGVTYASLKKEGVFNGVVKLFGDTRQFCQNAVVGGRTMTGGNKKHIVNEPVGDIDVSSMYPWAMTQIKGFIKGEPKILTNLTKSFLDTTDFYIIDINITKINKTRFMPLINFRDQNGVRQYVNKIGTMTIGMVALEELITHHQIEYEIIKGLYWNQGFNTKIRDIITKWYDLRQMYKKQGNPIEQIFKLLLNSAYGKTMIKSCPNQIKYIDINKIDQFISKNYNRIQYIVKNKHFAKVKLVKSLRNHSNYAHLGVYILDTSRIVMNKIASLAEDNGITLFYQDTDSYHLLLREIKPLFKLFREKYGYTLEGSALGQMHNDLEPPGPGLNEAYSAKSIFVGKKCYVDVVQADYPEILNIREFIESNGLIHNYHFAEKVVPKIKSIPGYSLIDYAENHKIVIPTIFEKLAEREKLTFNLIVAFESPKFRYDDFGEVYTKSEFTRTAYYA